MASSRTRRGSRCDLRPSRCSVGPDSVYVCTLCWSWKWFKWQLFYLTDSNYYSLYHYMKLKQLMCVFFFLRNRVFREKRIKSWFFLWNLNEIWLWFQNDFLNWQLSDCHLLEQYQKNMIFIFLQNYLFYKTIFYIC